VQIRVPQRGDKRELPRPSPATHRGVQRHRLRRAATTTARSRALNELQDHLELPEAPLRIECYDMSHIQGTDYVGSMVVVRTGCRTSASTAASRSSWWSTGNDDFAAMEEVLTRRFTNYLDERDQARSPSAASSSTRRSCSWSTAARVS
jgi:excinuclease ABC subunit C